MKILSSSDIKKWDQDTIQNEPISSLALMERAGSLCADEVIKDYDESYSFHIVVNKGNNGGDGLVIARKLLDKKYKVRISVLSFSDKESKDFKTNLGTFVDFDISYIYEAKDILIDNKDVVVDAIFGNGLNKPVIGSYADVINIINTNSGLVLSVDIPSGLFADDNRGNRGAVIKANKTYTLQCLKFSFLLPSYEQYIGEVKVIDIGLNKDFIKSLKSDIYLINHTTIPALKKRSKISHKGHFGHALLVGGNDYMKGAVILSTKAALKSGVGKISVSLPEKYIQNLNLNLPEAIVHCFSQDFWDYSAIGIGPGLGVSEDSEIKLKEVFLKRNKTPIVVDADALNIISKNLQLFKYLKDAVITPHVGEFRRLSGNFSSDEEKIEKQKSFAVKYKVVVVLKGANTTIATPDGKLFFNTSGNSGLATAGSGDVLMGIILSFLAQGYSCINAACLGVFVHGKTADLLLSNQSPESIIASDIIDSLGLVFKRIQK